jgi:hypothetical protein
MVTRSTSTWLGGVAFLALLTAAPRAQPAPDLDATRRILSALDGAVSSGDRDAFERCFLPIHTEQHARLLERLSPLFRPDLGLRRSSEVVRFFTRSGLGIAVVRTRTQRERESDTSRPVVEDLVLVVATDTEQQARIRLYLEVDPAWLHHVEPSSGAEGRIELSCPVCNYALDVPAGWLAVPNCRLRSGCLESYTIFALDADLTASFSVHVFPEPARASSLLTALTLAEAGPRIDDTISPIRDWTPPCTTAGGALDGAMCRLSDPERSRATELRLLTFGRVGYLLATSGPSSVLASSEADWTGLFRSLRLLDPELDPEALAARVLEGHVGGILDEGVYTNEDRGIRIAGPDGWACRLHAGQYAFDVTWDCPVERGTLRAKGLEPPIGTDRWTRSAADRTMDRALRESGLPTRSDTGWSGTDAGGFLAVRTFELAHAEGHPTLLHVRLADDLLVVIQGEVKDESARGTIRAAMESLRRLR